MALDLSICFSTYGQPVMLKRWFDAYLNEPEDYRSRCEVICVDDSGKPPAVVPDDPTIRLYRVTNDIPWNQPGARNLAAQMAKAQVLLLCDVDMTMPPGMLRKFVSEAAQLQPRLVLRPSLTHSMSGKIDTTSPNVHLIRRKDFFTIGGYNEEYSGHKGWSDVMLLRVMSILLRPKNSEVLNMILHHDSDIPDKQVTSLNREVTHNRKLHEKHIAICHRSGWAAYARSIARLRFEWTQVK